MKNKESKYIEIIREYAKVRGIELNKTNYEILNFIDGIEKHYTEIKEYIEYSKMKKVPN